MWGDCKKSQKWQSKGQKQNKCGRCGRKKAMYMSNQMPKNATPQTSAKDLATNTAKLDEIKYQNELSKQNIKKVENEKLLDNTEALKENQRL